MASVDRLSEARKVRIGEPLLAALTRDRQCGTLSPRYPDGSSTERIEPIARNQNTYAKRKREMEKKEKAEAKRMRRSQRKAAANEPDTQQSQADASIDSEQFKTDAD